MRSLVEALPAAASSPLALVAYLVVVAAWVAYSYLRLRPVQKAEILLRNIEEDSARLAALRNLTGAEPPPGLPKAQMMEWIRNQSKGRAQVLLLVAYLSTVLALIVVFTIAWTSNSSTDNSRVLNRQLELSTVEQMDRLRGAFDVEIPAGASREPSAAGIARATILAEIQPDIVTRSLIALLPERNELISSGALLSLASILKKGYITREELDSRLGSQPPILELQGLLIANIDLSVFRGTRILLKSNWRGTSFWHVNFDTVNLSRANLRETSFHRSTFNGASLCGANLFGSQFLGVTAREADLRQVSAYDLEIVDSDFTGVQLSGAIFMGPKFSRDVFRGAIGAYRWGDEIMPSGASLSPEIACPGIPDDLSRERG